MGESADDERQADQGESSEGLSPEAIVRRVALLLVPLLLVTAYFLRSSDPGAPQPVASTSAAATVSGAGRAPALKASAARTTQRVMTSPVASAVANFGEGAFAATSATSPASPATPELAPPPLQTAPHESAGIPAVDLPAAGLENSAAQAPVAPAAACGGLFVRLITFAEDKKFAFASMAQGFSEPAKLLHIGESIGGYRVTGIEWDRVWVQSVKERCAVGMHVGARGAQEQAEQRLPATEYARLPWVLPHSIVRGLDKRAEMEFLIGEPAIFALYARGADVFAGLRIKPYQNDSGETQGLQLFDILLDSFLERLGIEQGDVLVSIDETPIASINDVLAALERARDAASLTAGFLRDGEAFRLSLKARDGH